MILPHFLRECRAEAREMFIGAHVERSNELVASKTTMEQISQTLTESMDD